MDPGTIAELVKTDGLGGAIAGKEVVATVYGGATSANGNPYMRLETMDGGTIVTSAHMTSGTPVRIRGYGSWPVERFV